MKLSTLIKAWEVLHVDKTGAVGFVDLVQLFEHHSVKIDNDCLDIQQIEAREDIGRT